MLAATVFGIFLIPAIFYLVERWSGAGKEHASLERQEHLLRAGRLR